jgi:hypothetical protein
MKLQKDCYILSTSVTWRHWITPTLMPRPSILWGASQAKSLPPHLSPANLFPMCTKKLNVHQEVPREGQGHLQGLLLTGSGAQNFLNGTRTLHCFQVAAAARNRQAPCSWGIETTQFHSILLCCQLPFSIPCPHKNLNTDPLHSCWTMGAFMPALAPAPLG